MAVCSEDFDDFLRYVTARLSASSYTLTPALDVDPLSAGAFANAPAQAQDLLVHGRYVGTFYSWEADGKRHARFVAGRRVAKQLAPQFDDAAGADLVLEMEAPPVKRIDRYAGIPFPFASFGEFP